MIFFYIQTFACWIYSLWGLTGFTKYKHNIPLFFIYLSFFRSKREREREWQWMGVSERASERGKRIWIATKFVFAHFVVETPRQKRCLALPLCDYYVHHLSLSSSLHKNVCILYSIVLYVRNIIFYMWMYGMYFFLSSWYSFRLSRLNNFFFAPLYSGCLVYGSWPRCIL